MYEMVASPGFDARVEFPQGSPANREPLVHIKAWMDAHNVDGRYRTSEEAMAFKLRWGDVSDGQRRAMAKYASIPVRVSRAWVDQRRWC